MAHAAPHHDYHLVNPSPWPLVSSAAVTIMMIGAVVWMKGLVSADAEGLAVLLAKGDKALFFAGLAGVLVSMFGWWADVIKESRAGDHTPVVSLGLRYGMVLFIASEVMFFAAFFWMFFDMTLFAESRTLIPEVGTWADTAAAWSTWPPAGVEVLDPWHLPLLNTVTLLLSGCTVTWAHHALQVGNRKEAKIGLTLTVALGVFFTCVQVYEYYHILHEDLFFNDAAINSGLYGSIFFMATGFHGFHVLIGTIFLVVCLLRLLAGQMSPEKHFGFEAAAWYWHFVDVVWLFLFAFVYVVFG
ncbi:cytochrome c oxidase subunit 3 [Brevundimonas sp. S30B]|uniref:cytochrome c oxidase subunit 3 n=1 Tax=unclassified Brevundimonas TaxID=2622653 RepID=UPI001071B2D7|nr:MULTISPECIES: cytochrome c oxidase subunit 3 [unclassified Brevundimonas]QBX38259.1 cytochrome c oxidase subunit 3 [Brevundimonas sp. MF30-B]TFW01604.1 cytochrome c oxidase subunit 3 [Brevundimonas sp. S30B]